MFRSNPLFSKCLSLADWLNHLRDLSKRPTSHNIPECGGGIRYLRRTLLPSQTVRGSDRQGILNFHLSRYTVQYTLVEVRRSELHTLPLKSLHTSSSVWSKITLNTGSVRAGADPQAKNGDYFYVLDTTHAKIEPVTKLSDARSENFSSCILVLFCKMGFDFCEMVHVKVGSILLQKIWVWNPYFYRVRQ